MDFLNRARATLVDKPITSFSLGPKKFYLVTRAKNVQSVFRNTVRLASDELFIMAIKQIHAVTPKDVAKWQNDNSGRVHAPTIDIPEESRIWAPHHRIFVDYMNPQAVNVLTEKYCEFFAETLSRQKKGEWQSVRFYQWLQKEMARCAISSLSGTEILRLNPGFIDTMWDFDNRVLTLFYGLPRWLYSKGYAVRDAFHEFGEKWIIYAEEHQDQVDPNADWEPIFGTRFTREHFNFFRGKGFDLRSRAGFHVGTIWALNANTTPMVCWAMIEIIKDPNLLQDVRAAVLTAFEIDSAGEKKTEHQKFSRVASSPVSICRDHEVACINQRHSRSDRRLEYEWLCSEKRASRFSAFISRSL